MTRELFLDMLSLIFSTVITIFVGQVDAFDSALSFVECQEEPLSQIAIISLFNLFSRYWMLALNGVTIFGSLVGIGVYGLQAKIDNAFQMPDSKFAIGATSRRSIW